MQLKIHCPKPLPPLFSRARPRLLCSMPCLWRSLISDGQPPISGHFVHLLSRLQWCFLLSPAVSVISFARLAISSGRRSRFTLFLSPRVFLLSSLLVYFFGGANLGIFNFLGSFIFLV
ncbi:hypothetical protein LWI28_021348 [Acer negundo]|uniref:Transmembrane protein n=1 Tax=Acer negundo TaxID=4023 RepID=A0AAD5NYF7_ACENE|nr:hypothetical protein LWI28_021348 [Acer negundo]